MLGVAVNVAVVAFRGGEPAALVVSIFMVLAGAGAAFLGSKPNLFARFDGCPHRFRDVSDAGMESNRGDVHASAGFGRAGRLRNRRDLRGATPARSCSASCLISRGS